MWEVRGLGERWGQALLGATEGTSPADTCTGTADLRNSRRIHFHCLKLPRCGHFYGSPRKLIPTRDSVFNQSVAILGHFMYGPCFDL